MAEKVKKNGWERVMNLFGWKAIQPKQYLSKSMICAAPHTSNWDLLVGFFYYRTIKGNPEPHFVMKKDWFFWPLGGFFRSIGGIPVDRGRGSSLVDEVINMFHQRENFHIAVTPEGTRSKTLRWKTGFYRMAVGAGVPIELARIDYGKKEVEIFEVFYPTGNMEADIDTIRRKYSASMARYPEKFHDVNVMTEHGQGQ